jgi:hypothetical protein
MSQQNHSFIRQINAMLQALGSDEGQADPAPRLTFQQYMKYGPMSENVEGPIEPDEPPAVAARQTLANFAMDRMTQYDPYTRQRAQQAMAIIQGLGPVAEIKDDPAKLDLYQQMMQRAGDAATADLAQQWNPDKTRAAIIPNNFRQYPRGRPR